MGPSRGGLSRVTGSGAKTAHGTESRASRVRSHRSGHLLVSWPAVTTPAAPARPRRSFSPDVNLRAAPQMREYRAIADRVASSSPGRLLDWGCGWGHISHLLLERGLQVTSMEYRPGAAEGARERLERFPDVEAVLTPQAVRLPF